MRILAIGLIAFGAVAASIPQALCQSSARPTMANEEDFRRGLKELSNWGRWGSDDELGAANLITPAKRKQAVALVTEGLPVSLAHDVVQERAADAPNILERILNPVLPTGTADRYQYTGTYHGIVHSHLDSLDCHMMVDGKGYNGVAMEDIVAAGGCPKGSINALKDGVVTRAILYGDPSGGPRGTGKVGARDGVGGRRHPSVYRALETTRRARRLAEGNRVRRISRRRCVFPQRARRFLHRRRRAKRRRADRSAGICPKSVASPGAGRDGRKHFRQSRFRASGRASQAAQSFRVSVHGCAATRRKRDGISAQSVGDFLTSRETSSRREATCWDRCDAQSAAGSSQQPA
jgi:hypothetical protein